jgi:kynureninase
LFDRLVVKGVIGDWREPDIIRVAPVPLYNRFEDCWELVRSCRV